MTQWMELEQIASSIRLNGEPDAMIRHFNSTGKFFVQSLYGVVTDRGIKQIFTPCMGLLLIGGLNKYLLLLSERLLCRLEFMYFYGF
jgi:hypothetical protein